VGASVNNDRGVRGGTVDYEYNPAAILRMRLVTELLTDRQIKRLLRILRKLEG
jgi:hypothetical protein